MKEPFISDGKIHYNRTVQERDMEIFTTQLTQEEFLEAIHEGKKKKWYRLRNAEFWAEKELAKKV